MIESLYAFQVTDEVFKTNNRFLYLLGLGQSFRLTLTFTSITHTGLSETWLVALIAALYLVSADNYINPFTLK